MKNTTTTQTVAKRRPGRPARTQNAIVASAVDWKLFQEVYTSNLSRQAKQVILNSFLN
jgi:hypothetical protein